MPKVSKTHAAKIVDHGPVAESSEEVDGYSVNFVTFRQDIEHAGLFDGLPGDRCPCPHWGYVLAGRMTFRFDEHEEVYEAGDAFYAPGGHVPFIEAGAEFVMFSPAEQLRVVDEAIMRNMARLMPAQD